MHKPMTTFVYHEKPRQVLEKHRGQVDHTRGPTRVRSVDNTVPDLRKHSYSLLGKIELEIGDYATRREVQVVVAGLLHDR